MPPALSCTNHPDRLATARCPTCARPICGECTIKIDGINVCSDCLKAKARAEEQKSRPRQGGGVAESFIGVAGGLLGLAALFFLYGLLFSSIL